LFSTEPGSLDQAGRRQAREEIFKNLAVKTGISLDVFGIIAENR